MKTIGFLVLALVIFTLFMGAARGLNTPTIDWWVLAGGGRSSSAGNVGLNATLGQPVASTCLTGGEVRLQSGYWATGWSACGGVIYLPLVSR